jgi:Putative Flp pilus-assembly TadE/G-like
MILRLNPHVSDRRAGVVAVLIAVCLVVILGMAAISLDGGSLLAERQRAQAAADSAALAAAADLFTNYWSNLGADPRGTAAASAMSTAAADGYPNDGTQTKVTVNIPPKSGDYVGQLSYAEVIVQYNFQRGFSNIFARGTIPVRGRAVARGSPTAFMAGILVLDPTLKGALSSQGGGQVSVVNAAIIDDSNNSSAAIGGGGGTLSAPVFRITGNYTTSGGGSFTGNMFTGVPPTPDPLADLPVPDPTKLTLQSNKKINLQSGTTTFDPGVYRGGIQATSSANIVMNPGLYYMDGGGFQFTSSGSLIAEGVTIYNEPNNSSDAVTINGSGPLRLSAPTSGVYQGVTVFVDRTKDVPVNVQGNGSDTVISGTFYDAGGLVSLSGNGGVTNMQSQFISRAMTISGNGNINIQWDAKLLAQRRFFGLVE